MANPWFRLYSEFQHDPKVQLMPEVMQRRLVMLLCARCACDALSDEVVAFQWRIDPSEAQETKVLFMRQGFIDADWNVLNWNKRQFVSDSSTERVRKHRGNVTTMKRFNSVTVTAPDTEAYADTEAEGTNTPPKNKVYFAH